MKSTTLRKPGFGAHTSAEGALDYAPMRATNPHTGKRQPVVLMEPRHLERAVAVDSYPELREDLRRALEPFTKLQKRVLFRILVQGQTLPVATKGLARSTVWWWGWYTKTALPKLRKSLQEYVENGKVVIG